MGRLTAGVESVNEETKAAAGFLLQGVSTVALFIANDPLTIGVFSVIFGIGYGTYIPEFPLLVRKHFGIDHYGTVFGTLLTSFGIGAFIGPVFEGISVSGSTGYLPGFALSAAVSLIVGAHLLIRGRSATR
jgi:MFS family permease